MPPGIDPRADASALLGDRADACVLEPSPPPVLTGPWFADDPVAARAEGRPTASPFPDDVLTWDELARDDPRLAPFCADHWLGAWRALRPVDDGPALERTRRAWHAVAEQVLAPARMAAFGRIGLRFTAGGFGTPFFAHDRASVQLRVDGTELLVVRAEPSPAVTHVELREAIGAVREVEPPLVPAEVGAVDLGYHVTTTDAPDVLGAADAASTSILADFFGFGCSVLEQLRAGSPDAQATRCQLWPEHFDLAIELGDAEPGRRAAYGASPGDDAHPEPYLYVAPWNPPSGSGDGYWNDTAFAGASLPYAALTGDPSAARAAALEFLRTGRELLAAR